MGITSLKKLIKKSGCKKLLSMYRGKRLGIDTSIYLYRFVYRDDANAVPCGILRQLKAFHRYGIIPIYVFDGKVSDEVKIVIEERQLRRERVETSMASLTAELSNTLEELGAEIVIPSDGHAPVAAPFNPLDVPLFIDDDDGTPVRAVEDEQHPITTPEALKRKAIDISTRIASLEKQTRRPTREMVHELKQMFELLGVEYRQSPGESDVQLAEMCLSGEIDGIISEDTDMLPYGCEMFVTGFRYDRPDVIEFQLSTVLRDLAMTHEQFVDMCILCGCDYSDKIRKIGVMTGCEMIKVHRNIEGVLRHINSKPKLIARHPYPEDFDSQVYRARSMFLTRDPGSEPPRFIADENDKVVGPSRPSVNASRPNLHDGALPEWNFDVATINIEEFGKFLVDKHIRVDRFIGLCSPPPPPPGQFTTQRKLIDYFTRQPARPARPVQAIAATQNNNNNVIDECLFDSDDDE